MPTLRVEDIRRRRSTRRRALLALAVLLMVVGGWMYFNSVAGITGISTDEMDWDADGSVSRTEMLQAYHAVAVEHRRQGARTCSTYYWRADRKSIRVDCRTEFEASGTSGKP